VESSELEFSCREGAEDDPKKATQSFIGLQGEGCSGGREGRGRVNRTGTDVATAMHEKEWLFFVDYYQNMKA